MEKENKLYYYHNDINGAPLRLTDEAGNIVWNAHYDIFGKIDKISKNEIDNPIRMQGQYEDEETGLYYNRYRYYDSNISAYVSQDPLGLGAGENVYSYVKNSFGWIDPLGLSCKKSGSSSGKENFKNKDNSNIKSRGYDRTEFETKSGKAVKSKDATKDWDEFLGKKQTNIDPRDGIYDPDRIWSADGKRSIRFGEHEMNSPANKLHYHKETWEENQVENILQRVQK